MFDLILLAFTVGVFYAGFLAGAKYKTIGDAFKAAKAIFSK